MSQGLELRAEHTTQSVNDRTRPTPALARIWPRNGKDGAGKEEGNKVVACAIRGGC